MDSEGQRRGRGAGERVRGELGRQGGAFFPSPLFSHREVLEFKNRRTDCEHVCLSMVAEGKVRGVNRVMKDT